MIAAFSMYQELADSFYLDEKLIELDVSKVDKTSIMLVLLEFPNNPLGAEYDPKKVTENMHMSNKAKVYLESKLNRYKREELKYHDMHQHRKALYNNIIHGHFEPNAETIMMFNHMLTYIKWRNNCFTDIKLEQDVWDESLSDKAIKQLSPLNINFPYPVFKIDLSPYDWKFEGYPVRDVILDISEKDIVNGEIILLIIYKTDIGTEKIGTLKGKISDTIEKLISARSEKNEILFFISKVISVSMYLENFKKDKSRVSVSTVNAKISQKHRKKETSIYRKIYLKQPKTKFIDKNVSPLENRKKIKNAFIVRGHWRNQSYKNEEKIRFNKPR